MITLYGIKNCNTVKKAMEWLNTHHIAFGFHDYKKSGITSEKLNIWCQQVEWNKLLNQKGMTWRNLDISRKNIIQDEASAIELMEEKTSIIKRPIIEDKNEKIIAIGFNDEMYQELFEELE